MSSVSVSEVSLVVLDYSEVSLVGSLVSVVLDSEVPPPEEVELVSVVLQAPMAKTRDRTSSSAVSFRHFFILHPP